MTVFKFTIKIALIFLLIGTSSLIAQRDVTTHTRGKLWETLTNIGFIGSPGAWDYGQVTGVGFYPGFPQYYFPNHEEKANDAGKLQMLIFIILEVDQLF